MHPDKRREGRAIRKARRAQRVDYFAWKDAQVEYVTSGRFARDLAAVTNHLGNALAAFGEGLAAVGRAMQTPPARIQVALPPPVSAVSRSEVGVPYPTQSGVQRGREAHSDPALERILAAAAVVGVTLLPWQVAAGAAYLRGERLVVYSGRGGGRTVLGRVVEQAERSDEAAGYAWVDEPHHLQGD